MDGDPLTAVAQAQLVLEDARAARARSAQRCAEAQRLTAQAVQLRQARANLRRQVWPAVAGGA